MEAGRAHGRGLVVGRPLSRPEVRFVPRQRRHLLCRLLGTVTTRSVARASLLASPVLVVLFFTLASTPALAASSVPACGHANVNNPGHHYGLIKNGCLPTQSVPPPPVPVPTPGPTLKSPPAVVGDPAGSVPGGIPNPGAAALPAPTIITALPASASNPQLSLATRPSSAPAVENNIWVVMALLVIMVVLWLLLLARFSARALRLRMGLAPVPA